MNLNERHVIVGENDDNQNLGYIHTECGCDFNGQFFNAIFFSQIIWLNLKKIPEISREGQSQTACQ